MQTQLITQRETIARTLLHWILLVTAVNLVFNLVSSWMGRGYPLNTFLWRPDDNFGDFFSLLHTYPGGDAAIVRDRAGLHAILPADPLSLKVVSSPAVTNFHMMPLSTLVDLGLVRLSRWVDPVALFVALFAAIVTGWIMTALRFAASRQEGLLWAAAAVISYPLLMTIARGNLFAGLVALMLVHALLLGVARHRPVVSAVLLATACNFRPNAILFAVPLLLFFWPQRQRFAVALGASGLTVLAASLAASMAIYPAYTPSSIRAGLADYYQLYVVQGWGLAYGSSLFGLLRLVCGPRPGLDGVALALSLSILAGGGVAWTRGRMDDATLVFLAAASYCLGSTILGDYHLLAVIATPMALAATAGRSDPTASRARYVAMIASCLLLAPKNYMFFEAVGRPISLQVLINPLLLLVASTFLLTLAGRGAGRRTAAPAAVRRADRRNSDADHHAAGKAELEPSPWG